MNSRSVHLALHIHNSPEAMAERAAHIFAAASEEAIAERGHFRVALSGGKTPIALFRLLARPDWAGRLPWHKMSFFWVDERCVGPDHPESNYGMARRELLSKVPVTRFYRMRGEEDVVEEAARYDRILREEFQLGSNGVPRFDLMLLGMGDDGHTASLFPDSPLLQEKSRLVADVYVPEKQADRLTLTLPVINNSRICMFMVEGAGKHNSLSRVLNILTDPVLPAQLVRPAAGELIWITDEKAAKGDVN